MTICLSIIDFIVHFRYLIRELIFIEFSISLFFIFQKLVENLKKFNPWEFGINSYRHDRMIELCLSGWALSPTPWAHLSRNLGTNFHGQQSQNIFRMRTTQLTILLQVAIGKCCISIRLFGFVLNVHVFPRKPFGSIFKRSAYSSLYTPCHNSYQTLNIWGKMRHMVRDRTLILWPKLKLKNASCHGCFFT